MTLLEIMHAALEQLERPLDEATVGAWRERLVCFANRALVDLYTTFRPWRRETLTPTDGVLRLNGLSRPCSKVLGLERCGTRIPFHYGTDTKELVVPGWGGEPLTVVYRIEMPLLWNDADRTGLPPACDLLIVLYMVACDRMGGDAAAQQSARSMMALYEMQKRRLKTDFDEPAGCRFYNYR